MLDLTEVKTQDLGGTVTDTYLDQRQETIEALKRLGYSVLPVAPYQDPYIYPKVDLKNNSCPFEPKTNKPQPLFTGKNPSFLDSQGKPHLVSHGKYQDNLPSDTEIKNWFKNPHNGVGTLGGFNNSIWIDVDLKDFDSQSECDRLVEEWLNKYPELKSTWGERTHSGGYRVLVNCHTTPDFTNFAFEAGGKHRGEALGVGRFTVLAPTIGPSEKPYILTTERQEPVKVESLNSIGIYSTKKTVSKAKSVQSLPNKSLEVSYDLGTLVLSDLINPSSRAILDGVETEDRSASITTLLNEAHGWVNWAKSNGLPVSKTPEELAHIAGEKLGVDSDKVDRIINTINPDSLNPSTFGSGRSEKEGNESCWKKIKRLNPTLFDVTCTIEFKNSINKSVEDYKNNAPIAPLEAALKGLPLPLEMVVTRKGVSYKLPSVPDTARYIAIREAENLAFHKVQKRFFKYESSIGAWEPQEKTDLSRIVANTLKNTDQGDSYSLVRESFIRNTIEHLHIDSSDTPDSLPKHLIPFVGTWFDKDSKTFLEPSSKYFTTNPLPVIPTKGDYNRISEWLMKALKNDEGAYDLIRCLFWLILNGDVSRQVFYEICGLGGTGKGTLAHLLSACVGEDNKVSTSLCDLGNNRFEPARLLGKKLILLPDQKQMGGDSSKLKALTGGDSLKFESKGDPNMFDFYLSGVMVIFANKFIRFNDESDALQRRRIPIKFDVKATEDEKASYSDFSSHLCEVLPQWIYHILEIPQDWVYKTIAKRNALTVHAQLEHMRESNTLANWLEECVVVNESAIIHIGNIDDYGLYASYHEYCRSNGSNPLSKNNLRPNLENFLFETLKWKNTHIEFKRKSSGVKAVGLGLIEKGVKGLNPITRLGDSLSFENLEF